MEIKIPLNFRASWIPAGSEELNHSLCISLLLTVHSVILHACITSFTMYGQRKTGSLQREKCFEILGVLPKLSHFPTAKTQTQRAEMTCPRSHSESRPYPGLRLPAGALLRTSPTTKLPFLLSLHEPNSAMHCPQDSIAGTQNSFQSLGKVVTQKAFWPRLCNSTRPPVQQAQTPAPKFNSPFCLREPVSSCVCARQGEPMSRCPGKRQVCGRDEGEEKKNPKHSRFWQSYFATFLLFLLLQKPEVHSFCISLSSSCTAALGEWGGAFKMTQKPFPL